jgi:chaperonin cofactor prefoldin
VFLDKTGSTIGKIPALRAGETLQFYIPDGFSLSYSFSDKIGNGKVLCPEAKAEDGKPITQTYDGKPITIPTKGTNALYFNLKGKIPENKEDKDKLAELVAQLKYYSDLYKPLTWGEKKALEEQIADKSDEIAQLQEEIKPYTGMSLDGAVSAINERQKMIRDLHSQVKSIQKAIDGADLKDQVDTLTKQCKELKAKIESAQNPQLLRAGVLVIGEERKPVYYTLNRSGDVSAPWLLRRFQEFPVFTTNDVPYIVILGQQSNQDPQGLRATFASKAGTYIDIDPVRPLVTQPTAPSGGARALVAKAAECTAGDLPTFAYVDRVLQFTDRLAGETIYSVSVTGYGLAITTDTVTVVKGTTPSKQQQTVTAMTTLKPLDGDAWPQVHSLYRYNLSTGVVWSALRAPSFSRVATGNYLPAGCDPTMSVVTTGSTTSTTTGTTTITGTTVSTTTGTTTTTSPGTSITTTCMPTYQTLQVAGGPRVLPVLMFSYYWTKRDTQTKVGSWSWAIPVPAIGMSLTSPTDNFFLGGSSEFKFLRNVQLVYGAHLGRVLKLGANGFQNPTDSTAPQTTTSLHVDPFVGLTFNIDFVKGLFKP